MIGQSMIVKDSWRRCRNCFGQCGFKSSGNGTGLENVFGIKADWNWKIAISNGTLEQKWISLAVAANEMFLLKLKLDLKPELEFHCSN